MKKLAIYGIIVGSCVLVGGSAGAVAKTIYSEIHPQYDYSNFDESLYYFDADELINKIESYKDIETAVNLSTPIDLANYAFEKFKRCENCFSYGIGDAYDDAGLVHQQIRSAQIKNQSTYFEEAVSKSTFVNLANRSLQKLGEDDDLITFYSAPEKAADVFIDYPVSHYNSSVKFTPDEYKATYGKYLKDIFNYIIHRDTILTSGITKTLGGYEIYLNLDPVLATYKNKVQMRSISHLKDFPIYTSCELNVVLNSKLMIEKMYVSEVYTASMVGINATLSSYIEYTYFANQKLNIPTLEECFPYPTK